MTMKPMAASDATLGPWKGVSLVLAATALLAGCAVQPGAPLFGIESTTGGRLVVFGGGVLLRTAGGEVAGAVGVSAGTVDEDHRVAAAGAAAYPG